MKFNELIEEVYTSLSGMHAADQFKPIPKLRKEFKVGDVVNYEGDKDGWVIIGIDGDEYHLAELGEDAVVTTLDQLLAEN